MTEKTISFTSKVQPPLSGEPFILRNRVSVVIKHPTKDTILLVKDLYATTFPGGGVEPNETIEEAAIREAREETGYINFQKPIDTKIVVDFYRRHDEENRLSKTFIIIAKLRDLEKQKGEMESIWVKKEDGYDMLGTDVSKLVWKELETANLL